MLNNLGKEAVILVDNHPLHERHLAYLAGLGNYGKNTLLINPEYGSFFFISLVLTNLVIEEDKPSLSIYVKIVIVVLKPVRQRPLVKSGF